MTPLIVRPRTLPPELVSGILGYLELRYLFAPLATSRDWRRVALDHPTYWRYLHLASTSEGAINLFLLRISHSRERTILVRIDAYQSCQRIAEEVLPAIASRFCHVTDFAAAVHQDQVSDLYSTLRRPAPVLKRFQIFVIRPREAPLPVLPTDVFCGSAPSLTFVGFRDASVQDDDYPALSKVVDVDFGFTRAETFYAVPRLFSVFPRMRRFALYSRNLYIPEDLILPHTFPSEMATFECIMNPDSLDVMVGVLPYHTIRTVRVAGVADETVDFFTAHIVGDLTLEFTDRRARSHELFDIALTSTETGFKRIFGQSAQRYLAEACPISFLSDHDFAERLTALTIPNTLWGFLAQHLLPFPNVKTLTVHLNSPALPVLGIKWSISCAKLQTLRLAANTVDALYVSTERLAAFVAISLADLPSTARPALELDTVILEGHVAVLKSHLRIPGEVCAAMGREANLTWLTERQVDGPSRSVKPRTLSPPVAPRCDSVS